MSEENKEQSVVEEATPESPVDPSSPEFADNLAQEFSSLFESAAVTDDPQTEPAEISSEAEEASEEASAEASAEGSEPEQPQPQPEPEEKPLLSPQLAAAAAREREVRAKIKALEESRESDIEAAVREAVARTVQEIRAGNFEKYEVDPGELALRAYAAELGDEAPPELKQELGLSDADRKYIELQKQIEELKQAQEGAATRLRAQTALEQYEGYLSAVPSELPYLGAEASHDQQETLRAMAEVADYVYETEGRIPAAAEVAKVLDDQIRASLERYNSIHKSVEPAEKPTASNVAETPKQETTLTNDLSAGKAHSSYADEDDRFKAAMEWMATNYKPSR